MISPQDLAASPAWLPIEHDGIGPLTLVRLDEAAYRAASFLDGRILQAGLPQEVCPAATVTAAAASLAPGAHYIFHIGHVGSTLVSRLIGDCAGFFSIREPAVLRGIASGPSLTFGALTLNDVLGLAARTWRPEQRAVVKATSFVGEIAPAILEADQHARAILMYTPVLAFLRCILGGPNSRIEMRVLAPSRLARLRARLGSAAPVTPLSEGEWIAMTWLCEMTALRQAARRFGSRVVWVDFDVFLTAPGPGLAAIVRALGSTPSTRDIEAVVAGPVMHRYSKAPEHAYDTALRQSVLASADQEHGAEIRRGITWLERLAGHHALIDEVLAIGAKASA